MSKSRPRLTLCADLWQSLPLYFLCFEALKIKNKMILIPIPHIRWVIHIFFCTLSSTLKHIFSLLICFAFLRPVVLSPQPLWNCMIVV